MSEYGKRTRAAFVGLVALAFGPGTALAQETGPAGTGGATGDQINKVLGLDGKNSGKGLKFKLGILLAMTGPGSY
jgi:hypothetical protein